MNVVRSHPHPAAAARLVPSAESLRPDWKTAWPLLFWALWGVWLAVSVLLEGDLQPAMLRLLVGGAVLGYARPRIWYLGAAALTVWVPVSGWIAPLFGMPSPDGAGAWLVGFLPAAVGAFLGRNVSAGVAEHAKQAAK